MKKFSVLLLFSLLLFSCREKAGDKVMKVFLDGNPTTGYSWTFVGSDSNRVRLVDSGYETKSGSEGLVGAPGTFFFSFEGIGKGDDRLHFEYRRPWESGDPAKKHDVDVRIDGRLRISER